MTTARASLITVTYNSEEQLRRCWSDGAPQDCEWIVVDNASTDDSRDLAAELGAVVIALTENRGFATANNIGLQRASAEVVGFVNPDVHCSGEAVKDLREHLQRHGGLVAPQLVYPDGTAQPNGRSLPTVSSKVLHRLSPGNGTYRRFAAQGQLRGVTWAMGAAIFGFTADLARIGGWNEAFFLYYEDAEISLRAARHGLPTTLCGRSRMTHLWARETSRIRWVPWACEIASACRFYSRFPGLLLPATIARRLPRYRAVATDYVAGCCHGA